MTGSDNRTTRFLENYWDFINICGEHLRVHYSVLIFSPKRLHFLVSQCLILINHIIREEKESLMKFTLQIQSNYFDQQASFVLCVKTFIKFLEDWLTKKPKWLTTLSLLEETSKDLYVISRGTQKLLWNWKRGRGRERRESFIWF